MLSRIKSARTPVSNTGLNSQVPFSAGIDWLDVTVRGVGSGADLGELIKDLELLISSPIDFASCRPTFNGKHWAGSGRSENGALLWYNPPRDSEDLMAKSPDGNLFTHPGILPPPFYSITQADIEAAGRRLPPYAKVLYNPHMTTYVEPVTGRCYDHHGYTIEKSGIPTSPEVGEVKIALSARVLDAVDIPMLADYFRVLGGIYQIDCSRIDMALDDNTKVVPIGLVSAASEGGAYFNARYSKRIESGNRGEAVGKTVYFGSPQSSAKLRVYDKTVESKGVRDCNRWEVEFHRKKAGIAFEMWLDWMAESVEHAARKLADVVVSFIDFRDRSSGDPNRARCPRLRWYQELRNLLEVTTIRITEPIAKQSVQKTIDWVEKSVCSSVASLKMALGDDFFPYLVGAISRGADKMTVMRRKMVASTDVSKLIYETQF